MSLQIPIPGEVLPNILEIPMPGSHYGGKRRNQGLPRLSDIPVPFETHSHAPVVLDAKYEEELDGLGRITQLKTKNVSVYSGHTAETNSATNKFEDTNINAPSVPVPASPVTPKVTLLGVENARKRLKAFCIQKKQQTSLLSSTGSPKSPAPLSPSKGSLLIGKKSLHGSVKITPVPSQTDTQEKTILPTVIKKIAVKKENQYERSRTSLNAMKMLSSEIIVKQALSKLGVPLSLLPPVEAYQAKPAPLKSMPFHYSRFLYPSEIELLVQKASLIDETIVCNIAVPVDQEIKDLIESLRTDHNPSIVSGHYEKKKPRDRARHASYSSSGNNEPNEDISMEDLVVCDSWSLENDSNQMEVDFTEDGKVKERITDETVYPKDGAKKGVDGKSKHSKLKEIKPKMFDPIIDMFSFDAEKSKEDLPLRRDARSIKLSTSDSNDFSNKIYSPADSSSSLEDAIAFAANLSQPHNTSNVDEESQNAVDNDFDYSNPKDILHLESYYSPDMISSGDTTPIIADGKIVNRLDVLGESKKASNVDDSKKQSSEIRDDGGKKKVKKASSKDNSNSDSRSSFKEVKERSRETKSRGDDRKSKSDEVKYGDRDRNRDRRDARGGRSHSPQEKSKDKIRDSSKESHKDHPKTKDFERDRDGSQSSQVSIKKGAIKNKECSKREDDSPSKHLDKAEKRQIRSMEETDSRKARWDKNPQNPKNFSENNLDVWSGNSQGFVKDTPVVEDKKIEMRVDEKKDKKIGLRLSKMSEEAEAGWKTVEEVCAKKVHSDANCHRWTSFSPMIEFCENLSSCNCAAPKQKNGDSLSVLVAAMSSEEPAENCDASREPVSQGWYPNVDYLLTDKSTVELSTNWETDDSLSQNESRMKRNTPSLLLTTDNLAKFDTANKAESLKSVDKTNAKTKLSLIDVSDIPTPVEKPEISAAVPALDLEYEKFMEAVWPEITEKTPTDSKADAKSKSESVSLSIECNESLKNYFRSDDLEKPKFKPFDEAGMEVDAHESIKGKSKKGAVSEVVRKSFELALGKGEGKEKENLNKENGENWSESDTQVKKVVKKKSNSSSIKPAARRKGHAKISSRRKKGKKDSSHRKKNTSASSSGAGASSSTTGSSSSSSSSSSDSSDSNDRRKIKKKKSRTSLLKSKKKNKKKLSKAKELARKQRLKKKQKEKKKLREQLAAKLKGKKKRDGKRKDDPYSSEDQELKTEVLANKVKKVKKNSSKTSTKKVAIKRKGRESERDKKKRRKREKSSSSSSSSDSETMRKAKSKKKTKKRSSNAGSTDTSQHSSKKRRKTTDDNEIDPVLTDQFSMQTVLNIKREKISEDEMIKVTEEFSPRINRTVHNHEIISVNELHSDFVESNKKNVIIPDAVVKIEPPGIELIQEMQEASLPKDESERFSAESEHSNSTTSFASLRNSLSFEHNSNDSNKSAQSSDNNSSQNSESPCDNSTSSLKNDLEISRDVEMPEESPVKKAAGHFESVAKSMHSDSNSMIESTLGCGKDSSNIEHVKDIPKIVHSQFVLSADNGDDVSDIIVTSRPKEFASSEHFQEAISVESAMVSQAPVAVNTEKPKRSGIGLVTLQDIERNRRAVEEFDRLKREFEEFTRERLNVSNMSAERMAAAEELKRQFDMVENYDMPAVAKPVAVEMKPVTDIRPIPTVTGIVPQDSSGHLASKPVCGEIKWDWRPDSSHGSTANRSRRPSRWGVTTPHADIQNSVLIEVELKSDAELHLSNTNPLSEIPTPCTPDDEPSDNKVYKIQTISSSVHEAGGDAYHMDGMAAEYEERYDMYSEERAMNSVFTMEEATAEDEEAKAKKISLDDRINMVLQYPGLSAVSEVTNGASSPSPPQCVIKPSPDKGILVVAGVKITRVDPRTPSAKLKRVCFSDGLAPGQDSDDESVTPAKKPCIDSKKKKRSKLQCGGHAYPCPPSWPSYSPRWDPLPPPPPPPGSPPPQLYQPRCSIMTSTIMNAPDAFITRLPKIPSHTETIG